MHLFDQKYSTFFYIITIKNNHFLFSNIIYCCDHIWISSIITPVSHDLQKSNINDNSNMLICSSRNISDYYQCWTQMCCFIFLWIFWWTESSKEQHLFEMHLFCHTMSLLRTWMCPCWIKVLISLNKLVSCIHFFSLKKHSNIQKWPHKHHYPRGLASVNKDAESKWKARKNADTFWASTEAEVTRSVVGCWIHRPRVINTQVENVTCLRHEHNTLHRGEERAI